MTTPKSEGLKIWGSTGASVPDLSGTYKLPPGDNGDRERRAFLAEVQTALYSAVGSAQRAAIVEDKTTNAVHQLVVANAALVASESEAFLTLVSIGIEAPAQVHLRAIGEMTRRVVLCREHRVLALELYNSAEPAWRKMASTLPVDDAPEFEKGEKDMRALEQLPRFKDAQIDVVKRFYVLNDLEWTMLSKRSHGDIYALVQVSQSLRNRGAEVRPAINMTQPASVSANVMLSRAYGWVLLCFANIAAEFGIQTNGRAEQLFEKFNAMQQSDERTGVLRINPIGS